MSYDQVCEGQESRGNGLSCSWVYTPSITGQEIKGATAERVLIPPAPIMTYRHYKGGIYEVVCEARLESDPSIIMIVYKSEDGLIWTRPKEIFFEFVEHEGKTVQRFIPII